MGQYRHKPTTVEAVQWDGNVIVGGCPDWLAAVGEDLADAPLTVEPGKVAFCGTVCFMGTLEGTMRADAGDWIVKGTAGEIYAIKPEIFHDIYEGAETPAFTPPAQPPHIDARTGRPFGDHGTANQAIEFAIDVVEGGGVDGLAFLTAWRDGSASDEWPEFYTWLAAQSEPAEHAIGRTELAAEPEQQQ